MQRFKKRLCYRPGWLATFVPLFHPLFIGWITTFYTSSKFFHAPILETSSQNPKQSFWICTDFIFTLWTHWHWQVDKQTYQRHIRVCHPGNCLVSGSKVSSPCWRNPAPKQKKKVTSCPCDEARSHPFGVDFHVMWKY